MLHWSVVSQASNPVEEGEEAVTLALLCQEVAEAALTLNPHCQKVAVAVLSYQET